MRECTKWKTLRDKYIYPRIKREKWQKQRVETQEGENRIQNLICFYRLALRLKHQDTTTLCLTRDEPGQVPTTTLASYVAYFEDSLQKFKSGVI